MHGVRTATVQVFSNFSIRNLSFSPIFNIRTRRKDTHLAETKQSFKELFNVNAQTLSQEEYQEDPEFQSDVNYEEARDQAIREQDKFYNIKEFKKIERKYFLKSGHKEPQFLTWAMKDQVKYLHASDPDRWTPEELSNAFPISQEGVKKLLKSQWKPRNEKELEAHDDLVVERWIKYTKGELGSAALLKKALQGRSMRNTGVSLPVSQNMSEHIDFLKDVVVSGEENLFDKEAEKYKRKTLKSRRLRESFASIITDYEEKINKNDANQLVTVDPVSSAIVVNDVTKLKECKDLSTIVTPENPNEGDLVRIMTNVKMRRKFLEGPAQTYKRMTFTEYTKMKKKFHQS